jgi:hypothetical protein
MRDRSATRPHPGCGARKAGTLVRCNLADGHRGDHHWPTAPARQPAACCPDMDLEAVLVGIDFRHGDPPWGQLIDLCCASCSTLWTADVLDPAVATP